MEKDGFLTGRIVYKSNSGGKQFYYFNCGQSFYRFEATNSKVLSGTQLEALVIFRSKGEEIKGEVYTEHRGKTFPVFLAYEARLVTEAEKEEFVPPEPAWSRGILKTGFNENFFQVTSGGKTLVSMPANTFPPGFFPMQNLPVRFTVHMDQRILRLGHIRFDTDVQPLRIYPPAIIDHFTKDTCTLVVGSGVGSTGNYFHLSPKEVSQLVVKGPKVQLADLVERAIKKYKHNPEVKKLQAGGVRIILLPENIGGSRFWTSVAHSTFCSSENM